MSARRDIESLLLVAAKPMALKKLAELAGVSVDEATVALQELKTAHNRDESGIQIQQSGQQVQMVSSPLASKVVTKFLKDEQSGELTDPAIETLTIIAYRGPITKVELDQIRGVNCSLILRHLMIKGLVEAEEDADQLTTRYRVTLEFLQHLGVREVSELLEYNKLRDDQNLRDLLGQNVEPIAETEKSA